MMTRRNSRGQALVETAIIIPILLILLLGAIDFGRLFFGWTNLHQAVRIGANYAAAHPTMTAAEQTEFANLIQEDLDGLNCAMEAPPAPTFTTPGGASTTTPALGDYASLTLTCAFSPITPLADVLFGEPILMNASAQFPVRDGCVDCVAAPPVSPPVAADPCRTVPDMGGMSVQGARLAWTSAGFNASRFSPPTGSDTATVDQQTVTENDPSSPCVAPQAIFSSSVAVTTLPADPVTTGCATEPNLVGRTVDQARTAWAAAGFTGGFLPSDSDTLVVDSQSIDPPTSPASTPGVTCVPLTSAVEVQTRAAWPPPPPAPCKVPNFINQRVNDAQPDWAAAGFEPGKFTAVGDGNFRIRSQSLVGGGYVVCSASILVTDSPGQ